MGARPPLGTKLQSFKSEIFAQEVVESVLFPLFPQPYYPSLVDTFGQTSRVDPGQSKEKKKVETNV